MLLLFVSLHHDFPICLLHGRSLLSCSVLSHQVCVQGHFDFVKLIGRPIIANTTLRLCLSSVSMPLIDNQILNSMKHDESVTFIRCCIYRSKSEILTTITNISSRH
jgi:hypothetical protein